MSESISDVGTIDSAGVASDGDPKEIDRLLPVSTPRAAVSLTWGLVRRHRLALVGCLAAFVIEGLAGLVAPLMLGRIVDVVDHGGAVRDLTAPVLAIVVAAVVGMLAMTLAISLLAKVAEPALATLRERVLERALHLDVATLERTGSGDLLSRVGDDVRLVARSITDVVPLMVSSVLAIVLTAVGLVTLDWRLGLAGLLAVPGYVLALRWYLPRSGPYYRRERIANGARAEAFVTGMHASRTLRAFGLSEAHQDKVDRASWASAQISIDVFRLLTRFFARNNRAELFGLLLILVTGFVLVRGESVTVGAVTAAALLFHRLFNPIGAVMALFDEVQSAGASLTRLAGVANLLPQVDSADAVCAAPRVGGAALEVRSLRHEYVAGRAAVDDVTLHVPAGQRVAVVGSSGAGKSTLAVAVAGRAPTSGSVLVGGVTIAEGTRSAGRPTVVLVTQEVHVFAGTLRDNLTLARADASDADLADALTSVGATAWVHALPERLDTLVGDGAAPLTPAQAQQLALGRVLLADPPVVVLDEATAEAGSAGARDLEVAALAVTANRTALIVAHRLTGAQQADRVLVMRAGRVVEDGSHDELVAAGGEYAELWQAWSRS